MSPTLSLDESFQLSLLIYKPDTYSERFWLPPSAIQLLSHLVPVYMYNNIIIVNLYLYEIQFISTREQSLYVVPFVFRLSDSFPRLLRSAPFCTTLFSKVVFIHPQYSQDFPCQSHNLLGSLHPPKMIYFIYQHITLYNFYAINVNGF